MNPGCSLVFKHPPFTSLLSHVLFSVKLFSDVVEIPLLFFFCLCLTQSFLKKRVSSKPGFCQTLYTLPKLYVQEEKRFVCL